MPRLTAALIAAALLVPTVAAADVDRFVAIESAQMRNNDDYTDYMTLEIVGRLDNGAARTGAYEMSYDRKDERKRLEYCHRLAVLTLSKPGKYRLEVDFHSGNSLQGCRLVAVP
jgi:hypothetical protein